MLKQPYPNSTDSLLTNPGSTANVLRDVVLAFVAENDSAYQIQQKNPNAPLPVR
ncbi:hypothetical protein A2U01_0072572, partial [Trifolium medium]|nr:hypothetical protein [Trifolium medium]